MKNFIRRKYFFLWTLFNIILAFNLLKQTFSLRHK